MKLTKTYLKQLTYEIVGAAIEVHKTIGPGLLESVYHSCLIHEFMLRDINFSSEYVINMNYKGAILNTQLRCDFLIENAIILEIKAVKEILPIFEAQLITYTKLLEKPKGIMINFNVVNINQSGQRTYVNQLFQSIPN